MYNYFVCYNWEIPGTQYNGVSSEIIEFPSKIDTPEHLLTMVKDIALKTSQRKGGSQVTVTPTNFCLLGSEKNESRVRMSDFKLARLVDEFTNEMRFRLEHKHKEGLTGWDSLSSDDLLIELNMRVARVNNGEDAAILGLVNWAMMLWKAKKENR